MAFTAMTKSIVFCSLLLAAFTVHVSNASDPDILTDFIVPPSVNNVDSNFFTFTGMRALVGFNRPSEFKLLKATMTEFPALNGQSVSYAALVFSPGSVNPPHTHPRAAELLFLVSGSLQVGFVDTTNKLYFQTLQAGDMYVFPKGLVHFQYNVDNNNTALAYSAFGSANAGTTSAPATLFGTHIDDTILAKSFKTDVATVQKVKSGLAQAS